MLPFQSISNPSSNTGTLPSASGYRLYSILLAAFAILIAAAAPSANAQGTVTFPNSGFESPSLGSGNSTYGPVSGATWTLSSSAGMTTNGTGWGNPTAPEGTQVAYLQNGSSSITQSIPYFVAGTSYTVTFSAAIRTLSGEPAQTWDFRIDGTTIKSFDPGLSATAYTDYTATFTASGSTHVLGFYGTALHSGDVTVFIDNVRITYGADSSGTGLNADYFANTGLSGSPALSRTDATVNFDWAGNAPGTGVSSTNFSTRWSGRVLAQYTQTYTFYTNSDDGVRLWVNGSKLIDNWTDHSPTENTGTIGLTAGQKYDIVMEYYQGGGGATAQLSWSSPSISKAIIPQAKLYNTINGLKGEYFTNTSLSGSPVLTRTDSLVNFAWAGAQPDPSIPGINFSVRWTGSVTPAYSQTYTFYTNSDDGVRLWVNGTQLVNNWTSHPATENSGTITLVANQKYDIDLEYFQGEGDDTIQLLWSSSSTSKAIIPQSALCMCPSGGATGPLTVTNLGFESPALGSGVFQYSPSNASWTFPSGTGIAANGSGFTASNSNAPEGTQVAFIQGSGGFSQPIAGFGSNQSYTLTFSAAQRNYTQSAQVWHVTLGGTTIGTFSPAQSATSYTDYTAQFSTVGGTFVLAFHGDTSTDSTVFIDNVRITPTTGGNGGGGVAPTAPSGLSATSASASSVNLAWTDNSSNENGFKVDRKTGAGGTFVQVGWSGANSTSYLDGSLSAGVEYYYRIRAENAIGDSAYSNEASVTTADSKLTGVFIGTSGSYNNDPSCTSDKAMDGSISTFFDGTSPGNGQWVGLDLGSGISKAVSSVRYVPRKGWSSRMVGGKFQGSNASDFSSAVDLFTVSATPTEDVYAIQTVSNTSGFRYVRYLSPNSGFGNVSEVEFYGHNAASGVTNPTAPSSLTASASLPTRINLAWTDNSGDETGFKIERKTGSGGTYGALTTTAAAVSTYQDNSCSASTTYYYRVRATNSAGDSSNSNEANATTPAVLPSTPTAPGSLAASAISSSQINLTWADNSSNETGFKLERKTGSGGTYAQIATPAANATSYGDSGLTPGTQYYYQIRATNGGGDSSFSASANATTQSLPTPGDNIVPVAFTKVQLSDGFWQPRIETNRTVSLQNKFSNLSENFKNFGRTAGTQSGNHNGFVWADSDCYKVLEGMANAIAYHPGGDSDLLSKLNSTVTDIVGAQNQRSDGYLNTAFQLANMSRNPGTAANQEFVDPMSAHEDYCMGHMMEAAIAHYNLTATSTFINVARKNADYLWSTFGYSPKRSIVPGHQEVELALFKLYKVSGVGVQNDLDMAKFYLDERGRQSGGRPIYGEYSQDLYQIRNSGEPMGHGVRGPYMWTAAADVGKQVNDSALLNASDTLWSNVVNKKLLVTGNSGHDKYNEGYAPDYDLSNDNVWGETCSAVATMNWTQRLANIRADSKYTDVFERIMYNGFAAGRSIDGQRLYYNNFMRRTGTKGRTGIDCCATNIVRTMPVISGYQYGTIAGDGIWTHLYIKGQATIPYASTTVGINQNTNYPWDGNVTMTMTPATPTSFSLHLRIPDWALSGANATVNGQSVSMSGTTRGYLTIQRTWTSGDVVQLSLPMNVRRIYMNPNVVADQGRVAIARGPMIYCLEGNDNSTNVHRIVIPASATITAGSYNSGDLGGIVRLTGTGINADNSSATNFTLIPYAVWDNRNGSSNNSEMEVMIPETVADAVTKLDKNRAGTATVSYSYKPTNDSPASLNDGILPNDQGSSDESIPRITFWGHSGTQEWVQYDFPSTISVARSDLFWYADAQNGGGCDFPQTFTVQYWNGSSWQNVQLDSDYMNAVDLYAGYHFTIVRFVPVNTSKLRVLIQSKTGKASGLLEWRVP